MIKDNNLQLEINYSDIVILNKIANNIILSKSEILRKSISKKYISKEFDYLLTLQEKISNKCKEDLKTVGNTIPIDEISKNYPAYTMDRDKLYITPDDKPIKDICIKYPTYKISIPTVSRQPKDLIKILGNNIDKIAMYDESITIIDEYNVVVTTLLGMATTIKTNKEIIQQIIEGLENNNIHYSLGCGYYIKCYTVQLTKDKKYIEKFFE